MDSITTQNVRAVVDGSATVTGLILGLSLAPAVPLWIVGLAGVVAIGLGKAAFGGVGQNIFNPAMLGYALVLVAFPEELTHFDAITGATALDVLSHRGGATVLEVTTGPAFGSFGAYGYEHINLTILTSGSILILLRIVPWYLPIAMLLGITLPALLFFDSGSSASLGSPLFHLCGHRSSNCTTQQIFSGPICLFYRSFSVADSGLWRMARWDRICRSPWQRLCATAGQDTCATTLWRELAFERDGYPGGDLLNLSRLSVDGASSH